MSDVIRYAVDSGLARITLHRPSRLNAFDEELSREWARVTADATARSDVGAIMIDAAGPAFCAGGDVQAMSEVLSGGEQVTELARVINAGITALTESARPVVAAAHGVTAGGGLGILLASDYAIVGVDSMLGSRYANIGLTPDLSVTAHLARAVGERRALQLVLQDRMLTAAEAQEWGLVAEVVEGADASATVAAVQARAEAVARGWLDGAARAYGEAKRLVRSQPSRSIREQLDEEARTIGAAFDTADAKARIAAFVRR